DACDLDAALDLVARVEHRVLLVDVDERVPIAARDLQPLELLEDDLVALVEIERLVPRSDRRVEILDVRLLDPTDALVEFLLLVVVRRALGTGPQPLDGPGPPLLLPIGPGHRARRGPVLGTRAEAAPVEADPSGQRADFVALH